MTKVEYLAAMEAALSEFDAASRAEIILECVKSFSTGELSGKTEQQVIEELGSVEECVEALRELTFAPEMGGAAKQQNTPFTKAEPMQGDYPNVSRLLIELCADVVIATADIADPVVDIRGNKNLIADCVQEIQGDMLHVYSTRNGRTGMKFGFNFGINEANGLNVSVTLPRRMKEIILKLSGGDCKCENVQADVFTMASGGGDTDVKNCIAGLLSCTSGGGDHSLQGITAQKFSCTSGGGDMDIEDVNVLEMQLKTGGGDMELKSINAVTADMKTGGGDIVAKRFAANECKAITGGGDISINGNAIGKLFVKTGGGDISVNCVTLGNTEAITGSGDVELVSAGCTGAIVECAGVKGDISITYKNERINYRRNEVRAVGDAVGTDNASRYTVKSGWGDVSIKLS